MRSNCCWKAGNCAQRHALGDLDLTIPGSSAGPSRRGAILAAAGEFVEVGKSPRPGPTNAGRRSSPAPSGPGASQRIRFEGLFERGHRTGKLYADFGAGIENQWILLLPTPDPAKEAAAEPTRAQQQATKTNRIKMPHGPNLNRQLKRCNPRNTNASTRQPATSRPRGGAYCRVARQALMASKLGRSLGVGVCSL